MQGSFAVNTAINSLDGDFDIDRAIVIDSKTAPENPIEPKITIRDVLNTRNFKDPRIKKPCVTANYLSVRLHIDYTVYKKSIIDNTYHLAVGKEGASNEHKEWSESDQQGLIDWINNVDSYGSNAPMKRKQLKRLIRYMKRWRDVNFDADVRKKVFSIGLTVMVKEQYKPNSSSAEVDDDLKAMKNTVDAILNAGYFLESSEATGYRVYVKLPKQPKRDIFQHKVVGGGSIDGSDLNVGNQLRNKLLKLQGELQKALSETDEIKQCTILNNLFGDDFEIPKEEEQSSSQTAASVTAIGITPFSTAGASGTSQGA